MLQRARGDMLKKASLKVPYGLFGTKLIQEKLETLLQLTSCTLYIIILVSLDKGLKVMTW